MVRDRLQRNEHQRARRLFDERVASLFERLPMLSGFWVDEDERPEAAELLRGRTFARSLQ